MGPVGSRRPDSSARREQTSRTTAVTASPQSAFVADGEPSRCDHPFMALMLRLGEKVTVKGRNLTVTPTAFDCLPRARDVLVEAALARRTVSYTELKERADLPYAQNGLGRLLDLLSEDCFRRGEPSLASLVVNRSTGEVGSDFAGDPVAERADVFAHGRWS